MAKPRKVIETRFRRGSNFMIFIGLLSAICHSLLYFGFNYKPITIFCLAIPMVLDTVVRVVDPRLWGQELHYYCYMFSLIFSGVFLLLGLISKFSSHTGTFLKLGSMVHGLKRLGRWFGGAQLIGSRLFYFIGIVLYVFDGVLALIMENFLRANFSQLRVLILMNLGFHCIVLVFLLHGFVAGLEPEVSQSSEADPASLNA